MLSTLTVRLKPEMMLSEQQLREALRELSAAVKAGDAVTLPPDPEGGSARRTYHIPQTWLDWFKARGNAGAGVRRVIAWYMARKQVKVTERRKENMPLTITSGRSATVIQVQQGVPLGVGQTPEDAAKLKEYATNLQRQWEANQKKEHHQ